jgi:transposase
LSFDAAPHAAPNEADILASFPALPDVMEAPETVRQAVVFRIYPNRAQIAAFHQWIGAARWVWNRFVEINQHLYDIEKRFAFHGELSSLLPQMKKAEGLEWLAHPPAIHLVDVSRRYDAALRRYLEDRRKVRAGKITKKKAAGFPRFKSKRDREGSIYLSAQNIRLIRRDANPHAARGWVELPNMDDTVVWERVVKGGKRKGEIDRIETPLRRAIRIRGGRWPEGTIRSATIR